MSDETKDKTQKVEPSRAWVQVVITYPMTPAERLKASLAAPFGPGTIPKPAPNCLATRVTFRAPKTDQEATQLVHLTQCLADDIKTKLGLRRMDDLVVAPESTDRAADAPVVHSEVAAA